MSDAGGFATAPGALTEAAKGIEDTLAELRTLGSVGSAEAGRGITLLAVDGGGAGHNGVATALGDFCVRWEWGVRGLVQSGQKIVDGLNATGEAYQKVENGAAGLLKRAVFSLGGNPMADSAPAAERDWADVLPPPPDLSPESFARAADNMGATWEETGRDLAENSLPGMVDRALHGGDPFSGLAADVEGLSEIGN